MSRREKKMLIIGLVILLVILCIKYLFAPAGDKFKEIVGETSEISFELEKSHLQITSIQRNIKRFEDLFIECKSLENLFYIGASSDLRLEIVNYLDEEIIKSGLVIESKEFTMERVEQNESFIEDILENNLLTIPIRFTYQAQLNGGYYEFLTFMESLENHYKYCSISQLDIRSSSDKSKLDIFLVINSYCIEGGKDES